jgi:hypothetical protein
MHGFPLTFGTIYKRMHKEKTQYATQRAAWAVHSHMHAYLCPFCCMYHLSSHKPNPRYEQERWWIIWKKEMETA